MVLMPKYAFFQIYFVCHSISIMFSNNKIRVKSSLFYDLHYKFKAYAQVETDNMANTVQLSLYTCIKLIVAYFKYLS